ncbi:DUF4124 domain-containing protein [Caldimonas brevitalea]|uniref:Uncharacterized protein n=1 Tax=Caldimonas brevitalea TaxID=413882 RepID=A0A0G3BR86_9BURK|nr:DUF4124 domain-containing protein [Caldimonas brevitalea]AKJ29866.1 hypothetical protein AAW51_3175 [Caldimonas brevitalea]
MKSIARWALLLCCWAAALPAHALYKVVGPDGKVTYTDRPPTEVSRVQPLTSSGAPAAGGGASALPFELQRVVGRFPVTLYTSRECQPCEAGRALLRQRGVPYTEKTVNTAQDAAALNRLAGGTDLPLLQIGGQQIKGYAAEEWQSYLDTAGYPKQSTLPTSFQFAPPTPLVAVVPAPAPTQTAAGTPRSAPSTSSPPPPAGNAPPGFKF